MGVDGGGDGAENDPDGAAGQGEHDRLGQETINVAFREVIRVAAVRDLVAVGEAGAFDFLLKPGAEERMWG
jgi:FixJ family two-component response regulator